MNEFGKSLGQSLTRLAASAPFELWLVDLRVESEFDSLSLDEHERAARFVFPRDRRRFLCAHLALRQVLSGRMGLAPNALLFIEGEFGKPRLAGSPTCAFSLSHSDDVAMIAMSPDGEIGVDVEVLRAVDHPMALAERHFTPSECEQLAHEPVGRRELAFLRGWTRKEACLKAIGFGLGIAPETFETGLHPNLRAVQITTPEAVVSVEVHSFEGAPGVVGSLARVLPGVTAPCPRR